MSTKKKSSRKKSVGSSASTKIGSGDFASRDAMGLLPPSKAAKRSEKNEISHYYGLFFGQLLAVGQILAWGTYFLATKLCGQQRSFDEKFGVIRQYQLGYVFAAVYCLGLGRRILAISANGARAPARLDRPDQHIYKIMASDGPLADAPYVLLATEGAAGRFNRAQRGAFNTDESMPLVLANTILASAVFGPFALVVAVLIAYGRATFGLAYKEDISTRGSGLKMSFICEAWMEHIVVLCALKSLIF